MLPFFKKVIVLPLQKNLDALTRDRPWPSSNKISPLMCYLVPKMFKYINIGRSVTIIIWCTQERMRILLHNMKVLTNSALS